MEKNIEQAKLYFWILLDALIAVAALNVVFFVMPALAKLGESFVPAHTLTVTAEGKTTAAPDLATIDFSVVSQGQSPAALADNNNTKMNAVVSFTESKGVAAADITTTNYDLAPTYQWDKAGNRQTITGYSLTQTVEVKIRDLNNVAPILGGLPPLGVNQIGNVNFSFANDEAVLAAARADAFQKVWQKASSMAAEAGVSLVRVVNVSENNYIPGPKPYYAMSAVGMGGAPVAPNIQPGTQDITDNVTIVYETR